MQPYVIINNVNLSHMQYVKHRLHTDQRRRAVFIFEPIPRQCSIKQSLWYACKLHMTDIRHTFQLLYTTQQHKHPGGDFYNSARHPVTEMSRRLNADLSLSAPILHNVVSMISLQIVAIIWQLEEAASNQTRHYIKVAWLSYSILISILY